MLAKMLTRTVKASFHRGNTGGKYLCYFGMTAAFLHKGQQRAVLGPKLGEGVAEGIELLGIHGAGGLRDVFVLVAKRQENPPQLLAAELVDAGIARQPEKPRFELGRGLEAIQGPDHLDEHLLRQVLDVIASAGHGVYKSRDPVLVCDNELALGAFVALLSPPHKVGQRSR
jgi:hypothetical protein